MKREMDMRMKAQMPSSRSRYKTPLPFVAEVAHHEWTKYQSTNNYADDFAKMETRQKGRPPLVLVPSYTTISSTGSTESRNIAIMVDSHLPYQRLVRTDSQKLAAELDSMDKSSSSSDKRNFSQEITPPSEVSRTGNGNLTTPGHWSDETTPEESPVHKQAVLQPQSLFKSPAGRVERSSVSSARQSIQARSPIQIIDNSPPHLQRQPSQGKGSALSLSTKPKQQDYQFPVVAKRSQLPISPRSISQEQVIAAQRQYVKPDVPLYNSYHPDSIDQPQIPDRGKSSIQHARKQKSTRIRKQSSTGNLSQAKLAYQDGYRPPSQSKTLRPLNSRRMSDVSMPSQTIIDDLPVPKQKPATSQFGVRPPLSERIPNSNFRKPDHELESSTVVRRRRHSAATTRPSFSVPPSPAAQKLETPENNGSLTPAIRRQNPPSNHASVVSKPQARSASAWRPPSVWYENVDGVDLSTRPKSAKEARGGLSIPEIEARDIRDIPPFRGFSKWQSEADFQGEFADRDDDYAAPPPAIGGDPSRVRSISPRPARDTQDHIFFDNYCRAAADEMPNQRANPARARRSESVSRANISVPDMIREMPMAERESESVNDAEAESIYTDTAMGPDVARSRSLEEQDAHMTSRTDQVKSLLGGMMRSLSVNKKKDDYRSSKIDSVPDYKTLSEDPTKPERASESFLDDSEDADSVISRPRTMIWSPPKSTGRYSEDTPYGKKVSL